MAKKPRAKKPEAPARSPASAALDAAQVVQLVRTLDAAIAAQPLPYDEQDSPRDRLFALLMQRIDGLQAQRVAYEKMITTILGQPALAAVLLRALATSMAGSLRRAALPHRPWHVAAVLLAYTATVSAWRNDTTADLARTMRACDRALGCLGFLTQGAKLLQPAA